MQNHHKRLLGVRKYDYKVTVNVSRIQDGKTRHFSVYPNHQEQITQSSLDRLNNLLSVVRDVPTSVMIRDYALNVYFHFPPNPASLKEARNG
jgi:hypothetical protein